VYLVTLTSDRTWITDPFNTDNPGVICGTRTGALDDTTDGDIRYYPGDRVEGVARPQNAKTMALTLAHLSATQLAQIRAWQGQPVLIRRSFGETFFAMYFSVSFTPVYRTTPEDGSTDQMTYDVDITFTRITIDETLIGS
jgi:hypothetical protein